MSQSLLYSDARKGPSSDDRVRQEMRENRSRIEENTQRLSDLLEPWKGGGMTATTIGEVEVVRRPAASTARGAAEGLTVGGAGSILFIWGLTSNGVEVPAEVGGAIGVFVSGFVTAAFSVLRDWGIFR